MRARGPPEPMPDHYPIRAFLPLVAKVDSSMLRAFSAETEGSYPIVCFAETSTIPTEQSVKNRAETIPLALWSMRFRVPPLLSSAGAVVPLGSRHAGPAPTSRRLGRGRRLARRGGLDLLRHLGRRIGGHAHPRRARLRAPRDVRQAGPEARHLPARNRHARRR